MCHPADEPYQRHNAGTADEYDLFIKAQPQPFSEEQEARLAAACEAQLALEEERDAWKETAEEFEYERDDMIEQLEDMEMERDDYEQQRDELDEMMEQANERVRQLELENAGLLEQQLEQRSNPRIDPHVLCALFARMPSEWVANILTNVLIDAIVDPVQTTLEMYE
jgi:chromosome segregation ATPase